MQNYSNLKMIQFQCDRETSTDFKMKAKNEYIKQMEKNLKGNCAIPWPPWYQLLRHG